MKIIFKKIYNQISQQKSNQQTNIQGNRPTDQPPATRSAFFAHDQKVGCGYFFKIKFGTGMKKTYTNNPSKNSNKRGIFLANKAGNSCRKK